MPTDTIEDVKNANVDAERPSHVELASWLMSLVRDAREIRDNNNKDQWDRYERTYRGTWHQTDQSREGERSRLIAPALTQAIDSTAAAIEDAIFGRDQWFDLLDDVQDEDGRDVEQMRKVLKEDMDIAGVPDQIAKVILNGCLYGTGIGKLRVEVKDVVKIENTPQGAKERREPRPVVILESIAPWEFVVDSNARTVDDAFFCAHEMLVPLHKIWDKQRSGVYRNVEFGTAYSNDGTPSPGGTDIVDQDAQKNEVDGSAWITEYYGKIPARFVDHMEGFEKANVDSKGYVEAIVTVANEFEILRVKPNPFLGGDRPVVAYQHSVVPGRFYGAGIAEKGWNAQKALDAELRARMDALGLITAPMMGADITRLPRNPDMKVRPGKVWLTRGRPSEVLEPVILGQINPNTFNQSAEMERLVQVATGSIDSNAPLDNNRRNETASGISMIQSSALKRMRRTMWNLERQFLNPMIRKMLWRYQQFNPGRYPKDMEFGVKGTMGIVAREFEQSTMTALLSVLSPDHPSYGVVLKGVIELSGSPKRDEMLSALEESEKPDPQAQQMQQLAQQAQIELLQAQIAQAKADVEKTQSEIRLNDAKTNFENVKAELEDDKVEIQAANAVIGREKTRMAFEQNNIARDRNEIEKIKARNTNKGKTDGASK